MREQLQDAGARRTDEPAEISPRRWLGDSPEVSLTARWIAKQRLCTDVERNDRVRPEEGRLQDQAAAVDPLGAAGVADPVDAEQAVLIADRRPEFVEHHAGAVLGDRMTAETDVSGQDRAHPRPVRRHHRLPVLAQRVDHSGDAIGAGKLARQLPVHRDKLPIEGGPVHRRDDLELVLELGQRRGGTRGEEIRAAHRVVDQQAQQAPVQPGELWLHGADPRQLEREAAGVPQRSQ
nr:hypothetical protein [Kribbella steppae]